jgi:hypothetical protein
MKFVEKTAVKVARARAGRIRAGIAGYFATLADIADAYRDQDWKVLGFDSWQAYVDEEFSEQRLKLTPEHRAKAIEELRLGGLSNRAIATTLGVSRNTVAGHEAQVAPGEPPAEVIGADGKRYAAKPAHKPAGAEPLPAPAPDSPAGSDLSSADETAPARPGIQPPAPAGEAVAQLEPDAATSGTEATTGPSVIGPVGAGETAASRVADAPTSGDPNHPAPVAGAAPGPAPAGPGVTPLVSAVRQGAEALLATGEDLSGHVPDLIAAVGWLVAALHQAGPVDVGPELADAAYAVGSSLHRYAESIGGDL